MARKVLLSIFVLAMIFACFSLWGRYLVERNNNKVELVLDYNACLSLSKNGNKDYLIKFKEKGLTGVAIYQDNIKNLVNQQKLRLLRGNEIKRMEALTGFINPLFSSFPFKDDSVFIIIKDPVLKKRFLKFLPDWVEKIKLVYQNCDEQLLIYFNDWDNKYLKLSLGFDQGVIDDLKGIGLKVIPRLNNNDLELNWSFLADLNPDYVIFEGKELTGYPERIEKTAALMQAKGIKFGMIESFIAYQYGADDLARKLDYNLLRVHSIQQGEMNKYPEEKIITRYLRAARERNVRIFYLKPFLNRKAKRDLVQLNEDYLEHLVLQLNKEGFELGEAQSYPKYNNSRLQLLISSLGIMIGGIILLEYLLGRGLTNWAWVLLILGLTGELGLIYLGKGILLRQALALASSIIFPSLAIITQVLAKRNQRFWLINYLKASLISLIGVLFMVSSLAYLSFMLKVDQFKGVKFAFLLPLVIITIYYLEMVTDQRRGINYFQQRIKAFWELKIKVKHIVFVIVLIIVGIFYIGRTGNYPLLPVPAWELYLRDWLEQILYIRPRFKEFLLGHPFLIITLGLKDKIKSHLILYLLILLASIGQITILNTFSHIHTPIIVSLLRVFNGLWLGLIIGFLLLVIIKFLSFLQIRKRVKASE